MSWEAALIGGVASLIGGERANDANKGIASANNAFNAEQSAAGRDWQNMQIDKANNWNDYQRSTAHQVAIADMKAAGLNPMLAALKGGAQPMASSTGPTPPVAKSSGNPHMNDTLSPALNTAFKAKTLEATLDNMKETNENLREQNKLLRAQERKEQATADNLNANTLVAGKQIGLVSQQTATSSAQAQHLLAQLPEIKARIEKMKVETEHEGVKIHATEALSNLHRAEEDYKRGKISYQQYTAQIEQATAKILTNAIGKSDNEAEAQRSWWMKNIAPYMPEVLKGGSALQLYKGMGR